jgi:ATP-dependent Zn protease
MKYGSVDGIDPDGRKNYEMPMSYTFVLFCLKMALIFYLAMELMKQIGALEDTENGRGNNPKIEITKTENLTTRLDDVRGIDEIKEEIENLVRMLKNP